MVDVEVASLLQLKTQCQEKTFTKLNLNSTNGKL